MESKRSTNHSRVQESTIKGTMYNKGDAVIVRQAGYGYNIDIGIMFISS